MAVLGGRRLVAVMFCDMVGFTAVMQEDERAALALRDRYRTVVEELHGKFEGEIVQYYGDGTLSVFGNTADAVRCGVAIQQTLNSEPVVPVRVGVHVGDVVVEDHGLLGDAANVASRVESFGQPGVVLVSDSVWDLVKNQPDLGLVSVGEFYLDNVVRPHELFAVDADGLVVPDAGTLVGKGRRSGVMVRSNLPVQVTSFVGRVQESAELEKLIRGSRLVTVTGAGGCGKSRLGVEVAAELLDEFPDGVWLVELAPLSDGRLVVSTVANVLGVREQPGVDTVDLLTGFLIERHVLLVMDNCERLIGPVADLVGHLLTHTTGLRVVATSREPLHVRGEAVFHLPTLPVPDPGDDWETLTHVDSVRLFGERAEAAHPGFRVTHDNGQAVASICRHLDGIPLAVELAAAATRMFTPDQIDQRLDDRFRLLTTGARDDVHYHHTLEAAIDWSYQLLNPQLQQVFTRLAVFAGSFTLDAAEQVCADQTITAADVMDAVVHLADDSLLEVEQSGEDIRYDMLETIRAYAEEQADGAVVESLRVRHAAYFADLAELAHPQLMGPDAAEWTTRLADDYGNLRAALSWLATSGDTQQGVRMAGALYRFWGRRRQIGEGMMWLGQLLAADPTPSSARARALRGAALFGPTERAPDLLEEAVALFRRFGPDYELASALNMLADDRSDRGRRDEALPLFEESIEIARRSEDPGGIAIAAANLARHLAREAGGLVQALAYEDEAVDAARRSKSPEIRANLLAAMATVHRLRGDFDRAESLLQEVISIEATLPGTFNLPKGALESALLFHDIGDLDRAYQHMVQAVEEERTRWADGAGGWASHTIAGSTSVTRLCYLGLIEAARGNHHRATVILSSTETAANETGRLPGPYDQEWLDRTLRQLKETLGPEAFQSAWKEGAGMSQDETYDYALNLLDDA